MKKLYFLLFSILPLLSIAQGFINFDDDAKWSATTPASYGNHTYVDGNFTATMNDCLRNTSTAQDGFPGALDTYSIRVRNNTTTSLYFNVATGGIGTFSFQVRRWDSAPATNFSVETTIDNGTTWVASSTIDATVTTDSDWKTVSGIINSANANVGVRIISNGTTERIMVDNFTWTSPSSDPALVISSPSNGTLFSPLTSSVDVSFSVSNFTVANGSGDGYIKYSVNGGTAIDQFDTSNITIPVAPGQSYSVAIELVDNSGNPLSTPVTDNVVFSVDIIYVMSDLAALRADVITNGVGRYYEVSGNPVISYARATRNQKYIQDATAGILIDDNPGTITTVMTQGDAISGLKGQTSIFNGVLQLLPIENATIFSSSNTITPQVVTIADITANIEAYESELVQINGATFADGNGATTFAVNTNYDISDGTTMAFRSIFAEANYVVNADLVPSGANNITVLVTEFNGTPQVVARSLNDLTLSTKSFDAIEGLTMYPNPLSGNILNFSSTANAAMTVQIYNILGKEVAKGNVINNTFNTGNLNAGVYIVKVTEEGKTATRKLVVK